MSEPRVKEAETASVTKPVTIDQQFTPLNPLFATSIVVNTGAAGQVDSTNHVKNYVSDAPEFEKTAWVGLGKFKMEQFGLRVNSKWHVAYSWLEGQLDERWIPRGSVLHVGGAAAESDGPGAGLLRQESV